MLLISWPSMLKKLIVLVLLVSATTSYSSQICKEHISSYQKKYSSDYFYPHARIEHLHDLIFNSLNKFKLINDIYLHYITLSPTNAMLALSLENCLLDLLKITRENIGEESPNKIISRNIINKNFLEQNKYIIKILYKLSQKEQNFLQCTRPKKADFDNVIINEPGLEKSPDFARKLRAASEQIMKVYFEGHDVFYKHNTNLVRDFILLLKKSPIKNSVQKDLDFYVTQPCPSAFNNIKKEVRKIYEVFSGKSLPKSLSEIWEDLFVTTENIRQEIWSNNYFIIYLINQIKIKYDSSELILIQEASNEIISVLGFENEEIRERIISVF